MSLLKWFLFLSRVEALRRVASEYFSSMCKPTSLISDEPVRLDSVIHFLSLVDGGCDANVEVDVDVFRGIIDENMRNFKVGS